MRIVTLAGFIGALAFAGTAAAHGSAPHKPADKRPLSIEEKPFGREGDPSNVTRVIRVDMSDRMRFTPGELRIKPGETVRFKVQNSGKANHEMVLGTMQDLKKHAALMRKHPGMKHDEPYMAHVSPGRTERMVWQFTKPGEFYFGCLVPGHFEAGMVGKVIVH